MLRDFHRAAALLLIIALVFLIPACRTERDSQTLRPRQLRDVPANKLAFNFLADVEPPANLPSDVVKTATAIQVEDPILMTLDDPKLFEHPWIYIVEPGALKLTDTEVPRLREFLLRGGTAMFDDFHGPFEWDNLERQMKRVFPDRRIVEVPLNHPVFSVFYRMDSYPQVAGIGSFLAGRTWEKGGFVSHLRTILDDAGRPMMFINWNTDMGDGWEWSNAEEYPGYIKYTAMAYRMGINEIVYSLTH